ncbi:MAG: hypothetical protein IT384_23220 [Deltaproteobacteria bacterium]|nr:hypothetical protein [Deltaproteobacteria bacterium]
MSTALRGGQSLRLFMALALVVSALTFACRQGTSTPEDSLKAFLSAVRSRDAKRAFAMLSQESRAELLKDAEAVARATGDAPETDPAKLLFERGELMVLASPESISIASRPGESVVMRVSVKDGKGASIRMVREGVEWKVDLLASLQRFEPQAMEDDGDDARGSDPEAAQVTRSATGTE